MLTPHDHYRKTVSAWDATPPLSPSTSPWLSPACEGGEWVLEGAGPTVLYNYDGEPIQTLDCDEVKDPHLLDHVHLEPTPEILDAPVNGVAAGNQEACALKLQRCRLGVFLVQDPAAVVTLNMDYWPLNLQPPPGHTTRPPLLLTNIFLTHFINDTRPHIPFIPCCCTFQGNLLSNVYCNDDPVKMVEARFRQYRAVNAESLRDLFHCLNTARIALQPHVYPPSMQGRLDLLKGSTGSIG
jgi:hypothetical protein